jgi:hypothetical protein
MKGDIETWLMFLEHFNGITSYSSVDWTNDFELELFTDSTGNNQLGCGAILEKHWAFFHWPVQ